MENVTTTQCDDESFIGFGGRMFSRWICTPEVDREFRGLKLAGPADFTFSDPGGQLTLAGIYVVGSELPLEFGNVVQHLLIVAIDEASKREFESTMVRDAPRFDDDPPEGPPPDGLVIKGYFNPDLLKILELPASDATYVVYAALGPHRSNAIRIQVRK